MQPPEPVEAAEEATLELAALAELDATLLEALEDEDDEALDEEAELLDGAPPEEVDDAPLVLEELAPVVPPAPPAPSASRGPVPFAQPHASSAATAKVVADGPMRKLPAGATRTPCATDATRTADIG